MAKKAGKPLLIIGIILVIALVLSLFYALIYSPKGTLKDYLKTVQKGKGEAAASYLAGTDDTDQKHELTDSWIEEEDFKYKLIKDESWREKEDKFKPYIKYLAGYYKARVKVTLEDSSKTYMITLKRKGTDNHYNIFSYLFKGWEVDSIKKD